MILNQGLYSISMSRVSNGRHILQPTIYGVLMLATNAYGYRVPLSISVCGGENPISTLAYPNPWCEPVTRVCGPP